MGKIGLGSSAAVYGKFMSEEMRVLLFLFVFFYSLYKLIKNYKRDDFYTEWKIATSIVIIGSLFCGSIIFYHLCVVYNGFLYDNLVIFMWSFIIFAEYFHYRGLIVDMKRTPTPEKIKRVAELKKGYCILLMVILTCIVVLSSMIYVLKK